MPVRLADKMTLEIDGLEKSHRKLICSISNAVSIGIFSGHRQQVLQQWSTCILCLLCESIQYVEIPPKAFESRNFV